MDKGDSLLKHFKSAVEHSGLTALKTLDQLTHLEPDYRKHKAEQVRSLTKQVIAEADRIKSSAKLHQTLARFHARILHLVTGERIVDLMNKDIGNVQQSSLTQDQQMKAIKDIQQDCSFTEQQLKQAKGEADVQMVYTLNANAIKGALMRYSVQNKDNALDELSRRAKHARQVIDKQDWDSDYGPTQKAMVHHELDRAVARIKERLQKTSDFNRITKIQSTRFDQIDEISSGHDQALQDFARLNSFHQHVGKLIGQQPKSDQVGTVRKVVDQQWRQTRRKLQKVAPKQYRSLIRTNALRTARTVWTLIVKVHQKKLKRIQDSGIRHDLANQIKTISGQVRYQFKMSPDDRIERTLTQGQKMLAHVEAGKQRQIDQKQVKRSIKLVRNRIQSTQKVGPIAKERALVQLKLFTVQLKHLKKLPKLHRIHQTLQDFWRLTAVTGPQRRLKRSVTVVKSRIRNSHLETGSKQALLKQLKPAEHKRPNVKRVKVVVKRAIATDLKANVERSSRVTKFAYAQVQVTDPAKHYMQILRRSGASFTWHHSSSALLARLDHDEQIYEDRVAKLLIQISHDNPELTTKHHAFAIMTKRLRSVEAKLDRAVLEPEFARVVSDRLVHQYYLRIKAVVQATSSVAIRRQITKFGTAIKRAVPQSLAGVRQRNLRRLKVVGQTSVEWLKMMPSYRKQISKVKAIIAPATSAVRNATNVERADGAEQDAEWQLNRLTSAIVGQFDLKKPQVNQNIEDLRDQAIVLITGDVKSQSPVATRYMAMSNRAHRTVNFGNDQQIKLALKRYQAELSFAVRRDATRQLTTAIDRHVNIVKKQLKSGSQLRSTALAKIDAVRQRSVSLISSVELNRVPEAVDHGKKQLEKIEQQLVDHDPAKRHARQRLAKLTQHMHALIKQLDRKAVRKELDGRLKKQATRVDNQLQRATDADVHRLYTRADRKLQKMNVKLVRNVQLQKLSHRIDKINDTVTKKMPLLNTPEVRKWHAKLNRSYHKAVYQINQVQKPADFVKIEQQGADQINAVYAKIESWNGTKESTYQAVKNQISVTWTKIQGMRNLQDAERKGSQKLFNQIKLQAQAKIKRARNVKQVITAKIQCELLIQNVADKIHSASILVTQIRATHNEVANSTMNKDQKKAALHQINRIINSGLDSVKASAKKEQQAKANAKVDQQATTNQDTGSNSVNSQPKPKKRKPFQGLRKLFHKIF